SKGAKIINLSLGHADSNPDTNKLNLMVDYATERFGAMIVAAAGNENSSAVTGTPNGQYNSFTVGATYGRHFERVTGFSNYSLGTDKRTKPDLVAPGQGVTIAAANWEKSDDYVSGVWGTSFSAPMVGGILAQMMSYGHSHDLSTDPLVLKAVMLTGTTKV